MDGQRLARIALLLDAAYCAIIGAVLVVLRERLARVLRLPAVALAIAGLTVIGWAGGVVAQSTRRDWRAASRQVAVANVLGAGILVAAATVHPRRRARALLAFTAMDVFAFAIPLLMALLRGRRGPESE